MATRKILIIGDETLRKKSKPVEKFDERLAQLIDDMYETMKENQGAGISAVQIGVMRRVFITEADGKRMEFVNPVIKSMRGKIKSFEGCLSVPGKSGKVKRPKIVEIEAFDRFGNKFTHTSENFEARAVCHEYDHLEGILYIDLIEEDKTEDKKDEGKN